MRLFITFLIILVSTPATMLAEVQVTARFNPPSVTLGNSALYLVQITETSNSSQPEIEEVTSLPLPQSHGLSLSNGRISRNRQAGIINGVTQYSVTQTLSIDASAPSIGSYTMPTYAIQYKGQPITVPAATLQVIQPPDRDEIIFLEAELPDTLYLGQSFVFNLKFYAEENVRLQQLHSFDRNASGFTMSERPEHSSSVESVNGSRYEVLTWPFTLTPIQTGEQELSFELGVTARLPDSGARNDSRRSPFGRSLIEEFFGRTEQVNVFTEPHTINVLPLPEKGQPESFSGAIGDFAIEVGADAEQATQGEPIMLSLVIKGRGNFERINGPRFPESGDWKYYDPESKFEGSDELGLSGSKRFDYVFIPQKAGDLQLPETRFSYFDPDKEEYIELTAPPIPVKILPAKNTFTPPPTVPTTDLPESNLQLSKSLTSEEALLTLDYRPKAARPVGYAILQSPLFISLNTLAGLAVVGAALALRRRKRNREDPAYPIRSAAKEALKNARRDYLKALQQSDAEAFYKLGQQAIRHAATIHTGRSMQSADSEEIGSLLPDPGTGDCRSFFEAANAHRFGGQTQEDLKQAQQQIERILKAL